LRNKKNTRKLITIIFFEVNIHLYLFIFY